MVKISQVLSQAREELDRVGVGNGGLDSLILLSYALSVSKEYVIFNPDEELSFLQEQSFFDLVNRRVAREPVSHIIQKREFFGADFFVNSKVLDPRPDSETLIETVLKIFKNPEQELDFLELGVGSGCLIVTLLKSYKNSQGVGVDISNDALEVCRKNATNHLVESRLETLQSDLFEALVVDGKFDIIVSNPPYIPSRDIENLEPEVKIHEPRIALDGGQDGLDFYKRIATGAENFLKSDGKIILEIGFGQHAEVAQIFAKAGFDLLTSKADLSGVVRVLVFERSS